MTADTPAGAPATAAAGRRTLVLVLSSVTSSIGALFAVIFLPLTLIGVLGAEPLDGAWNEGSNAVNVVFAFVLAVGLTAVALFPVAGAILGRKARSVGLTVFGLVTAVALVVAGVCGIVAAGIMGSGG